MKKPQGTGAAKSASVAQEETCKVCNEGISNPICPECLEKQMQAFFGERIGITNTFAKKLATVATLWMDGASWCIICGKEMGVCAHCYSADVFDEVREEYPELEEEFLTHFNYYLSS